MYIRKLIKDGEQTALDKEQVVNGLRFTPMKCNL